MNGEEEEVTDTYATTDQVDDAIAWILDQEDRDCAWFAMLSFNAPHDPFHDPPEALHSYGALSNDQERYRASVEALDTEIGRLMTELGSALDDAAIIFIGDNGTPGSVTINTPPYDSSRAKGTPYEGGVNVPMIVSGLVVDAPGRESTELVHTVDLFETIVELTDGVSSGGLDSISMVPYLESSAAASQRSVVMTERFRDVLSPMSVSVRGATYKYIDNGGVDECYELAVGEDPASDNLWSGIPPFACTFLKIWKDANRTP